MTQAAYRGIIITSHGVNRTISYSAVQHGKVGNSAIIRWLDRDPLETITRLSIKISGIRPIYTHTVQKDLQRHGDSSFTRVSVPCGHVVSHPVSVQSHIWPAALRRRSEPTGNRRRKKRHKRSSLQGSWFAIIEQCIISPELIQSN